MGLLERKEYGYIEDDGDFIFVLIEVFPIIWNRKGLFRIFSASFIKNKIENLKRQEKIYKSVELFWQYGEPVPDKIAKLLLSE